MTSDSEIEEMNYEDLMELQAYSQTLPKPKKDFINNTELLLKYTHDLDLNHIAQKSFNTKLDFLDTLSLTPTNNEEEVVNEKEMSNNDLQRELYFYTQALNSVNQAISQLSKLNIEIFRPSDYFCEMSKSDQHMKKVREKLVKEAKEIKDSENRRKMRELKKFGKKVQQSVHEERMKQKKEVLDKISEHRKKRNFDNVDLEFDEFPEEKEQAKSKKQKSNDRKSNKKRQQKNEKYGFGGKKRNIKENTKSSTEDFDFSIQENKRPFGAKKGKQSQQKRMGKNKRRQMKGKGGK